MNISKPFILRPVMTLLIMAALFFFGFLAYKKMPVSDLPNVDFPTISVYVDYPGANPQVMASTCATPLERELMTIENLNAITSTSETGKTQILLQFALNKSLDAASTDVQAAINRALPNLPKDLPSNPYFRKVNPTAIPILLYALTSETLTKAKLYDFGKTFIGQRLTMVEGVSDVETYGSPYATRIQVDPEKLASLNIGIDEVALAIKEGNVNLPTGTLYGPKGEFTIDVQGQLLDAQGYKNLVIRTQDGSLLKLYQVGKALDSLTNDKFYAHFLTKSKDTDTVVIAIKRQSGANGLEIIKRIKDILPILEKQLPSSLKIDKLFDQSDFINEGVKDVKMTLLLAFILVVFIIFIFLGKLKNTMIPSLALPLSILGAFPLLYLLGFSIDILSLSAITLATGFLIDDAIVVLENNVRHVELGENALEATLKGSKEISTTILSITLSLIAVFIPLLFLGGVVGRLFREFAVTIIATVFLSGFISLSLTPLLCSKFIKYGKKKKALEIFSEKMHQKLLDAYSSALKWSFFHKKLILLLGALCLMGSLFLLVILPKDFLPTDDMNLLQCYTQAKEGTSPFHMTDYQKKVSKIIVNDNNVDSTISVSSIERDNEGIAYIKLKPFKTRDPLDKTISSISRKLSSIVGLNSYVSPIPLINLQVATQAKALYQYAITSTSQELLNKYTPPLEDKIKTIPGLEQVSSDLQVHQPQVEMQILRDRASDLKVSAEKIEHMLSLAYSGGKISTIDTTIDQYDVIIETLPSYYQNPTDLSRLYIRSEDDNLVPLSEVVKIEKKLGPLTINHLNGIPSATISFNIKNISLGEAISSIEKKAEDLPTTITGYFQGTASVFKEAFANLPLLFLITLFVVYIILGILYESFTHPFTVMSTLPSAAFGALLSLFLFKQTFSIYSFIGVMMVIGIVMKNGIMMVDFAIVYRKEKSIDTAITEACLVRFRPILMTSVAAIMGALPIALGLGGSLAEGRKPLGIAVVGGLLLSQVLTLFLTPCIYYYLESFREKVWRLRKKKKLS